ncbi:hypothetical protein SAMD00019534_103420, partial [Acytostelium subglobosum LB1]|uniref:hypothetical protein n=1 Tax=Acytostelium subglobosum LB1 TaxID=1410327 RepID=UPI0006450720
MKLFILLCILLISVVHGQSECYSERLGSNGTCVESNSCDGYIDPQSICDDGSGITQCCINTGFKLIIHNDDGLLNQNQLDRLHYTFAYSYPFLYNNYAAENDERWTINLLLQHLPANYFAEWDGHDVILNIEVIPSMTNMEWFVHELTHTAQNYDLASVEFPRWWVEGMAEVGMYWYAPVEEQGKPFPGEPKSDDHYDKNNGYEVAARWFMWIEKRFNDSFIETLNHFTQTKPTASEWSNKWVELCGSSPDDIWAQYVADPSIPE